MRCLPLATMSVLVALSAGTAGCRDRASSSSTPAESSATEDGAQAAAATEPGATEASPDAAKVKLAAEPDLDLLDHRYLWHLHRDGLVIALAGEGVRKYTQEYSRPWRGLAEVDGAVGRILERRSATLTFPHRDEPAASKLLVRAHGLVAGQKLSLRMNGAALANVALDPSWQTLSIPVPADRLRRGENELSVFVARRGTAAGQPSHALFHSIEIAPEASEPAATPLSPTPVAQVDAGGDRRDALTGYPRLVELVEIPERAWLEIATGAAAEATFTIAATTVDGKRHELLSETHGGDGWRSHQISLAALAGELVALELRTDGVDPATAGFAGARIALEATEPRTQPEPAANVILLVVDALRSDKLPLYESVYGDGHAVAMPNLVAAAGKGSVVYLHNQAASPSSPPSHGSIQTGMIPRVHGVAGDKGKIAPGTPTLATQLDAAGVAAGYFGNNPFGMGRHEHTGGWTTFRQPGKEGKSNDCTTLMEMMLEFAREQSGAGKRFFISSLPYETHTPYRYHEGITEKYYQGDYPPPIGKSVDGTVLSAITSGSIKLSDQQWKQLKGLYDGEAEYMDRCIGQLVTGLEEAGLMDDTALVLTSDHGEGMFEHGHFGHAWGHNRELGDVPFVILWPELADGVVDIDAVTNHIDIVPTLLDMMGVDVADAVQGESVLPMALRGGPWTPRVVSLEYGRSYSLRSLRYKMIVGYDGSEEYFDLGDDPWEKHDMRDAKPMAVRYLRDLAGFFLEHRSAWKEKSFGTYNDHEAAFVEHAGAAR